MLVDFAFLHVRELALYYCCFNVTKGSVQAVAEVQIVFIEMTLSRTK